MVSLLWYVLELSHSALRLENTLVLAFCRLYSYEYVRCEYVSHEPLVESFVLLLLFNWHTRYTCTRSAHTPSRTDTMRPINQFFTDSLFLLVLYVSSSHGRFDR